MVLCALGLRVSNLQIDQALAAAGLAEVAHLPCRALSSGQRRRVALARLRLLLGRADLWLLDEPFAGLDSAAIQALEELLGCHVDAGGAVVFSSHHRNHARVAQVLELGNGG